MKLIQRKEIWWVDFRPLDGKRRRLSTGESDKTKAQLRAADIVRSFTAASNSTHGSTYSAARTLGEHLESHYVSHWTNGKGRVVMRCMIDLLKREVGYWPIDKITYRQLKDYGDGLVRDGKAHATVNRRMSAISTALHEARRNDELAALPEMPHYRENNLKERYMSLAEEADVFARLDKLAQVDALKGEGDYIYMAALAPFLIETGFRFSEAFKFTVDGTQACLAGDTKTDKARRVPMTIRAQAAAQIMLAHPWHKERLTDKQRWAWAEHRWGIVTEAAGCRDVTLHILRHTCASRLVQRGINLYVVSKWLGHSSVRTTERYAHLAPDTLTQALSALERGPVAVPDAACMESSLGTRSLHLR